MNYMERALSLAHSVLGYTSPNPAVGAVIVKDGVVVGEGSTKPPGQSHAEIVAIQQAGKAAEGATMYVSLEPCCYIGRTPPCTEAIIKAGLAEVHMAALDPNPRVHSNGKRELEKAGIRNYVGEKEGDALRLNEAYAKFITTGQPFVTAKFAASLDGKIATRTGQSRWITGVEARRRAHHLRSISDVVMVGVSTVVQDDPQLTVRDEDDPLPGKQPARVVVDSTGRTPPESRIFQQPGRTLLAMSRIDEKKRAIYEELGAEVIEVPPRDGIVNIKSLLYILGEREFSSVLVEGGGTLLGSFFDERLVDKVVVFLASTIMGGRDAPTAVAGVGIEQVGEALHLKEVVLEQMDTDIMVTGYPDR